MSWSALHAGSRRFLVFTYLQQGNLTARGAEIAGEMPTAEEVERAAHEGPVTLSVGANRRTDLPPEWLATLGLPDSPSWLARPPAAPPDSGEVPANVWVDWERGSVVCFEQDELLCASFSKLTRVHASKLNREGFLKTGKLTRVQRSSLLEVRKGVSVEIRFTGGSVRIDTQNRDALFDELSSRLPELGRTMRKPSRTEMLASTLVLAAFPLVCFGGLAALSMGAAALDASWPWEWDWGGGGGGGRVRLSALLVMIVLAIIGLVFIALAKLVAWMSPSILMAIGGGLSVLLLLVSLPKVVNPPLEPVLRRRS